MFRKAINTRGNLSSEFTDSRKISQEKLDNCCKNKSCESFCRYIMFMPIVGYFCAKNTRLKEMIDKKVEERKMIAKGDNCDGLE